jgi:hypothetical protein
VGREPPQELVRLGRRTQLLAQQELVENEVDRGPGAIPEGGETLEVRFRSHGLAAQPAPALVGACQRRQVGAAQGIGLGQ